MSKRALKYMRFFLELGVGFNYGEFVTIRSQIMSIHLKKAVGKP